MNMITVIYVDDLKFKHYVVVNTWSEVEFLKARFDEVYIL